jgi:hypothetical protein
MSVSSNTTYAFDVFGMAVSNFSDTAGWGVRFQRGGRYAEQSAPNKPFALDSFTFLFFFSVQQYMFHDYILAVEWPPPQVTIGVSRDLLIQQVRQAAIT